MVTVEMKKGNPPMDSLTTVFIADEENWAALLKENIIPADEVDASGKPRKALSEEELNALADYGLTHCQDIKDIFNYYFVIGAHFVAFGSRAWFHFLECAKTRMT
jgi:hypothetical protein